MDQWGKKPLNFDPGTLVAFLREEIFQPLEMSSPGEITDHEPADASAYTRYALGRPRLVAREGPGWMFAAGELAHWDMAFLDKKILSPRSYQEFTREVKLKDGNAQHHSSDLPGKRSNQRDAGERAHASARDSGRPARRTRGPVTRHRRREFLFPRRCAEGLRGVARSARKARRHHANQPAIARRNDAPRLPRAV